MFFIPGGPLSLSLGAPDGTLVWTTTLGAGVLPGVWFCPILPFDLDGDGDDEIWLVSNTDPVHPLAWAGLVLERRCAADGRVTGQWPWPFPDETGRTPQYAAYRHVLMAGQVRGEPVLVCGEGTYGTMRLKAFRPGMSLRWEWTFTRPAQRGPRGSHQTPVCDINGDGVDELIWGERVISLDTGATLVCCDEQAYDGHSDLVQPFQDRRTGAWSLYTLRESDPRAAPRAVCFGADGRRLWGALDQGHLDQGWIAQSGADRAPLAWALRIGSKGSGPAGFVRTAREEFLWDARTGRRLPLDVSIYGTLPVDLTGAGRHLLVRALAGTGGDGAVLDPESGMRTLGHVAGQAVLACRLFGQPGERIVCFEREGLVTAWGDADAEDTPVARARYANPFYAANARLAGVGYNWMNLGGL